MERMEGWKDGRMDGWQDGRKDGWKDGRMAEIDIIDRSQCLLQSND
jgi:hypothetical protein